MVGNKGKLFCLYCRFIGWFILCIITLGLAGLYVGPYISVSCAKFYDDLKNDASDEKIEFDSKEEETVNDKMTESPESEPENDKDEESEEA